MKKKTQYSISHNNGLIIQRRKPNITSEFLYPGLETVLRISQEKIEPNMNKRLAAHIVATSKYNHLIGKVLFLDEK